MTQTGIDATMAADETDRRQFLSGVGGTIGVAITAGCLGGSGADEPEDDESDDPIVDAAETTRTTTDPDAWTDVREIRFDGYVGGWVGVHPSPIDRVENPTLVLVAGRAYEFTWENMDGVHHNIALFDADEDVVDEYSTPGLTAEGERETLRFEATPAMDHYRCEYQPAVQHGDITVIDPA